MHVFRKKGMGWNRLFLLQGGRKNFWYCTALKGERNKKNESWKFFNRLVTGATIDSLDRYCNLESIFWKRSWIRSFKNFDSASPRVWLKSISKYFLMKNGLYCWQFVWSVVTYDNEVSLCPHTTTHCRRMAVNFGLTGCRAVWRPQILYSN